MSNLNIKYGDTLPVLILQLSNPDGTAYNLSTASGVSITLDRYADQNNVTVTEAARTHAASVYGTASNGQVSLTFTPADWGTGATQYQAGYWQAEVVVDLPGTDQITIPNTEPSTLRIWPRLA